MSCIYVLNCVFLFILSTVVTRNDWSKIYSFVRFTHRRKLNFISVFLGCICRLCKRLKSIIMSSQSAIFEHMFLENFRSIFRNASSLLKPSFLKSPDFNNYPSLCKIQFKSFLSQMLTYLNFDEIEFSMKHRFLQWLSCTWICLQLFYVNIRNALSHSLWQGLFYSQH